MNSHSIELKNRTVLTVSERMTSMVIDKPLHLSDERFGAKLRVTENRCVVFVFQLMQAFTYVHYGDLLTSLTMSTSVFGC